MTEPSSNAVDKQTGLARILSDLSVTGSFPRSKEPDHGSSLSLE